MFDDKIDTHIKITKLQDDPRDYSFVRLTNGMEIVYIHDIFISTSIACLKVNIGSYYDPDEYLGLAHFLEHMIFMGSKKYPEGKILEYVNSNGGFTNAYTTGLSTCYHFNITSENFNTAFDILIDGILDPLLSTNSYKREINAVNSEYMKGINNISNASIVINNILRSQQSIESNKNNRHNFPRFSVGNIKTLDKNDIVKQLKMFHSKYYSPNRMRLVVLHNKPLFEFLRSNQTLLIVKSNNIKISEYSPKNELIQKQATAVVHSIKLELLTIMLLIPRKLNFELNYYGLAIIDIITSKHKNSLYWTLYNKKLITNLKYAYFDCDSNNEVFQLILTVTKQGTLQKILTIITKYFDFLKDTIPPKYIYDENFIITRRNWIESIGYYSTDNIISLANIPSSVNPTDFLLHEYQTKRWNTSTISNLWKEMVSLLTLDKSIVVHSTKKKEGYTNTDEHYPVKFKIIPNIIISKGDYNKLLFRYRKRNSFIKYIINRKPPLLRLVNRDVIPKILYSDNEGTIFGQTVKRFDNKVAIILHKYLEENEDELTHKLSAEFAESILNRLFIDDLKYQLLQIHSSLTVTFWDKNIVIEITSYENCIPVIFNKICEFLCKCKNNNITKIFNQEKLKQKITIKSIMADIKLNYAMNCLFKKSCNTINENVKIMKTINSEDCIKRITTLFKNVSKISLFTYGNYTKKGANKLYTLIKKNVVFTSSKNNTVVTIVPPNPNPITIKTKFSSTSIIKLGYAINLPDIYDCVAYGTVLVKLIDQFFFNQLRTIEQLGYSVYSYLDSFGPYNGKHTKCIVFYLKSNIKKSKVLKHRILEFIKNFDINKCEDKLPSIIQSSMNNKNELNNKFYSKGLNLIVNELNINFWNEVDNKLNKITFRKLKIIFNTIFIESPDIRCVCLN